MKKIQIRTRSYYKTHEGRTDGLKSNLKRHGPVVITDVHTRVIVTIQAHAIHGVDGRFHSQENRVRFGFLCYFPYRLVNISAKDTRYRKCVWLYIIMFAFNFV